MLSTNPFRFAGFRLVILHNVVGMSRVLKQLQAEGAVINQEVLAGLAPYRLEHINRFGADSTAFHRMQMAGRFFVRIFVTL